MTLTRKQEQDALNASLTSINEKLQNLTNSQTKISTDVEEVKNVIIKNLVEANKNLQNTVKTLQEKIKKMEQNEKETKIYIEKQNQYGRRNNVEISGIDNEIEDDQLEDKVIDILQLVIFDFVINPTYFNMVEETTWK